ncbi:hypothetical protein C2E23DRAFT_338662 [Lenzites betulinus]|nr:hypothetical protein C2E23DRAFT_338662 [Lenzites betulinus]
MQVQSQKPHFKDRFRNLFGPPIIKKRQPRKTNAPVPAGDPPPPKKTGRLLGKKKAGVDAPGYHPDPAQQPIEPDNNRAQAQEPPLPAEVPGPAMSAGLLQGPGVAGGGERGYPFHIGGASNAEAGPSMARGSAPLPVQPIQVQDAGHPAVMIPIGGPSASDRTQQQQTGSNRAQAQESGLPAEVPRMSESLLDNAPFRFAPGREEEVIANDRGVDRYAPQGSGMTGGHHGYTPHAPGFTTHAAAGPSTASSGFGAPPTHMDPLFPRYNPPVLAPPYPYPYPPYPYPTGAPRPARRRVLQQPRQHQAPQDVQPGRTAGIDGRFALGLELRAQMGRVPPADHDGNIRRAGGVPPDLPPPEPDPLEAVNAFLSRAAEARRSMNPRASRQDTTGYASRPSGMAGARRGGPLQIAGVPNTGPGSSLVGGTSLTAQDTQPRGEAADEQDKDGNGQVRLRVSFPAHEPS